MTTKTEAQQPEMAPPAQAPGRETRKGLLWALAVGVVWQALWWDALGAGLNALLGTLALVAAWWALLRAAGPAPRGTQYLLALTLVWALVPVWRAAPAVVSWTWLAWWVTLFVLLPRYFRGDALRATGWGLARLVVAWLRAGLDALVVALHAGPEARQGVLARWRALLLGLVLLVPIGGCFGLLLAWADPVFQQYWIRLFSLDLWLEGLGRALLGLVFGGLWLSGLMAAWRSRSAPPADTPGPAWDRLPWASTAVVLGGLLMLFTVFLGIQARYLFGGSAALQAFDLTYAEYARRGFGELVTAVVLFLGLLVLADALTARPDARTERGFRLLAWATLAAVALMLASAAYRLGLYVTAFGLTTTRFQVAVFMFWLLVALALAAWTVRSPRPHRWPRVGLIPFFAFVLTLAVLSPPAWVVRVNIWRAQQGHDLDIRYLLNAGEWAPEVWVALEAVYQNPDALPETTRQELGAALACQVLLAEESASLADADWRAWSWGRWQGRLAYQRLTAQAREAFPVREYEEEDAYGYTWPRPQVRLDGRWRSCLDFVDPYYGFGD